MKKIFLPAALLIFLSANSSALKVLLIENSQKQTLTASGPFTLTVIKTDKKYKLKDGGKFEVKFIKSGVIKAGSVQAEGGMILKPAKDAAFTIDGNKYNGSLFLIPSKNNFNIIEETPLENYLYGVLPYEMSPNWPLEALKAQAVAARTFTAKILENPADKDFDLYPDIKRSQLYKGSAVMYPSVKKAVDETRGQVLKFENNIFYAYYHANCGGQTDPLPWANPDGNIKPTQGGVKSGHADKSPGAVWTRSFTNAEVAAAAAKSGLKGTVNSVTVSKKAPSGRATQLTLKTANGNKSVSCNDFRLAIGSTKFKSCMLTKIKKTSKGFEFNGKGYGHGTGLCQESAQGMAQKGKDYKEILSTFYPGANITKL